MAGSMAKALAADTRGIKALESEVLVTDDLLKVQEITAVQRIIYESTYSHALKIRESIDVADTPTVEDIQLIFKQIIAFGISQKALAHLLGVTTGTLSRWVSGENPPRDFVRGPIVQQLGKVVDHVIDRLNGYTRGRPTLRARRALAPVRAR